MELFVKGELHSIFKTKPFTDKVSGEVRPGKHQLQFLSEKDLGDGLGVQLILDKISIPDSLYPKYSEMKGREVTVKVGVMVSKGKPIYYGIE